MSEETPENEKDIRNPPSENENMEVVYANNSHIDGTIWDLQIVFGEYSPRTREVDWHTTVTMPWAQAKLMAYFLQVQVAVYEFGHGEIRIGSNLIPGPLPPPTDPNDEREKNLRVRLTALREAFIASLEDDPNPKK